MVQSVERTFDILEVLAIAEDDLSLSQISEQLDLPLGTVHRLLGTLVSRGYAAQDRATRQYGPGPRLLEMAARAGASRRFQLDQIARPILQELTASTAETSNLLLLRGDEGVYSAQVPSPHMVRMFTEVGQRVPLYCTGAGKAILSGMAPDALERYLAQTALQRFTAQTLTTPDDLRAAIAAAREQGFALDDEEREPNVCCVAAPIFDRTGACLGAISISGPSSRLSLSRAETLGPLVRAAADRCSRAVGYSAH
jgi:IclR family transcriptional regulator, acetate operon repressor